VSVAEKFFSFTPTGRTFKVLRYLVKAAEISQNIRSTPTIGDLVGKTDTLKQSMMMCNMALMKSITKGVVKEELSALSEVDEGHTALLESGYGSMDGHNSYSSSSSFFDVLASSRRASQVSDPHADVVLSSNFGSLDAISQSAVINALASGFVFSQSNGFDVDKFGLMDSSTILIEQCSYVREAEGQSSAPEECQVVFRGEKAEIFFRLVALKSQLGSPSQQHSLVTAVRALCEFKVVGNCTTAEASRVQIVKTIDAPCPGERDSKCVQIDVKIRATNREVVQVISKRISKEALSTSLYHSSNHGVTFECTHATASSDRRAASDTTKIYSMHSCLAPCGQCQPGYYGDWVVQGVNTMCKHCPAGKYWNGSEAVDGSESSSCIMCPAGKFSMFVGAKSSAMCIICPQFSTSNPGSTSICNCKAQEGAPEPVINFKQDDDPCRVQLTVMGLGPLAVTLDGTEPDCLGDAVDLP
jgi:hypothetical protein